MMAGLRLPDLSLPPAIAALPAPQPAIPPDPALLEAARLEGEAAGRAIGHAEGLAEGRALQAAAQEAAMKRALEAMARAMADATQAGQRVAEDSAHALAALLLATLDTALPGLAARHAPGLVEDLVRPLLPAIANQPEAILTVAPALVAPLTDRLPQGGPSLVGDASVPPGDARIEWRDGALVVSLDERRRAIAAVLRQAGIWTEGQEA